MVYGVKVLFEYGVGALPEYEEGALLECALPPYGVGAPPLPYGVLLAPKGAGGRLTP